MRNIRNFLLLIVAILAMTLLTNCQNPNAVHTENFEEPGNWRTGSDDDAEGEIINGVYDFFVKADDMVIWTTAGEEFDDGEYKLEAKQVEGSLNNGYGMIIRANDETDDFYLFKISGDGYVWIGRYRAGGQEEAEPLVGDWWFESTAVNQGLDVLNRLRIRAEGANMIFYVNDEEVGRVTDDAFSGGDIGFLVETLGEGGVRIHFDNFLVTPIDAIPPERY